MDLYHITSQFETKGEIISIEQLGEGFINDTFIAKTKETSDPNYLLQRKNKNIFKDVPAMMENISKVVKHLKQKIIDAKGNQEREALTIILSKSGELYYIDDNDDYWVLTLLIEYYLAFDSVDSPEIAFAGGQGVGKFQTMLSDFQEPLANILPGFHDMAFRFRQWDEVIAIDPVNRKKDVVEEISWIDSRREEIEKFWGKVENGEFPVRVTHNDTKISNILFNKSKEVLCVIDLDTVMKSHVLNDFGDAIRSYTNTGKEDDENLGRVSMDFSVFEAFARGYLSQAKSFLTPIEIDYLAFSAKLITYEQVLRFLMDYIDGDNYYKVKSPNHNLIRTRAQHQLLLSIEKQLPDMEKTIKKLCG